jgi:hypothetical protein
LPLPPQIGAHGSSLHQHPHQQFEMQQRRQNEEQPFTKKPRLGGVSDAVVFAQSTSSALPRPPQPRPQVSHLPQNPPPHLLYSNKDKSMPQPGKSSNTFHQSRPQQQQQQQQPQPLQQIQPQYHQQQQQPPSQMRYVDQESIAQSHQRFMSFRIQQQQQQMGRK